MGQWLVLRNISDGYSHTGDSHVLGGIGAKSLVETDADETVGLAGKVDNLPLLTVHAPDTNSPAATGTLVELVAIGRDSVKGNLGGRLHVGRDLGVTEATKALEREQGRAKGIAALLNGRIGSVNCGSRVSSQRSRLGRGLEDTLAEQSPLGVARDR